MLFRRKINTSTRKKKPITKQLYNIHEQFDMRRILLKDWRRLWRKAIDKTMDNRGWGCCTKHSASSGEIYLWLDKDTEESSDEDKPAKKRSKEESTAGCSRRQEKEIKVEKAFEELIRRHDTKYKVMGEKICMRVMMFYPMYQWLLGEWFAWELWCSPNDYWEHESSDVPPNVPLITGISQKTTRKDTLSDAITAAAIIKAASPSPAQQPAADKSNNIVMSPGRRADVPACMKNLQQLQYLQQLHEDKILTASEFAEQKKIMGSLFIKNSRNTCTSW